MEEDPDSGGLGGAGCSGSSVGNGDVDMASVCLIRGIRTREGCRVHGVLEGCSSRSASLAERRSMLVDTQSNDGTITDGTSLSTLTVARGE